MSGRQELHEEEHVHTPSLFMGASPGPIPERVIELIMARTAGTPLPPELEEENATEEREAAAALASSSLSTLTTTETTAAITAAISEAIASEENKALRATAASAMDVDKDESSMDIDVPTVSIEADHKILSEQTLDIQLTIATKEDTVMAEPDTVGTTSKAESEDKALSPLGTSTSLSVSTSLGGPKQKSASKSTPPRYQVIFEFKENPGVRWLFPSETSLELTPAEDNEPAKISSSFYLTTQDDKKSHSDGTSPSSTTPTTTSSQAITMVILQATNELWEGLDRSILDSSLVYRSMMDKMRHIPVRSYIQYTLPVTFTNEDLAPMGLWKLPDNKVVTIKSLQPPKRRSEPNGGRQSKPKRPKAVHETPVVKPSKKITVPTPVPKQITNKPSEDGRACRYCGTRDTPMWRRGPDGTKTLCNSCGISWKRGKIEVTSTNGAVVSVPPPTSSRTRAPVQQAPVPAPAPRAPTPPPPPPPPPPPAVVKSPAPPLKAPAVRAPTPAQTPVASAPIITTADAAIAILKESLADEPLMANGRPKYVDASLDMRPVYRSGAHSRRTSMALKRHDPYLSSSSSNSDDDSDDMMPEVELVPLPSKKQRFSKGSPISSGGPKLVPINQISATNLKPTTKSVLAKTAGMEKEKEEDTSTTTNTPSTTPITTPTVTSTATMAVPSNTTSTADTRSAATTTAAKLTAIVTSISTTTTATALINSTPASLESTPPTSAGSSTTAEHVSIPRSSSASTASAVPAASVASVVTISAPTKPARSTAKSTGTKEKTPKSTAAPKTTKKAGSAGVGSTNASPTTSTPGAMTPPLTMHTKHSPPTSIVAKMTLLKSPSTTTASAQATTVAKHAMNQPSTAASPSHTIEDGLSLYPAKNLYTNNTATFPLHFPTISIAFGPNNAYYTYPNCAVVLFENHFQIKLMQGGTAERTEIDIWKEAIESTEFHVVDVGDGESMIVLKALLRQFLTRFDKELLNPDKDENLIVFRFRERLDGGGPPVKPLLEQWLTTEIPVATPVETPVGTPKGTPTVGIPSTSSSVHSSASTTPTTRTGVSNVAH
ncbi:hypothetical protein BG003_002489 [Podila horticola]|nr:hypothetical protein BG003_002489 [Podila horticola]